MFDPLRPSEVDRHRVRVFTPRGLEERIQTASIVRPVYPRTGLDRLHQARALLCDGPRLLRGLCIGSARPLSARMRAFRALVPTLRWRWHVQRALDCEGDVGAAIDALERVAGLLDRSGRIVDASAAAMDRLRVADWRRRVGP